MQFVSRTARGAPTQRAPFTWVDSTKGVKIHYEGTAVPADLARPDQHHRCADRVNAIEQSHLANTAEGYIAIAYSAMVCPHGTVYEGRGTHALTGANGNGTLNRGHYAVCAMLGDSGLTEPTKPMLTGLRDAVEWLQRDGGAGPEIKGHRDGYATSCPGEPLYRWVQAGAPRPTAATQPPEEDDMPLTDTDIARVSAAVTAELTGITARDALAWANRNYDGDGHPGLVALLEATRAELVAQRAVLTTLLDRADGVDTAAVEAAISAAVDRALGDLDIHLTNKTTTKES